MRLPRRIADILKRKQEFIDAQRTRMEMSVVRLQSQLVANIIAALIPELDVKDGLIQDTAKNYRLLSVLDKAYRDFQGGASSIMLNQILKTTTNIVKLSADYFAIVMADAIPAGFEKAIEGANKLINLKIGLDGGKLQRGGFLQSFFDSNIIGTELKELTSKAVTSGMNIKDYVKALKDKITGIDEAAGLMERQYQRYAYDLYQQYDAAYNMVIGNKFGFKYFVYQGGLVKDSRDFCVAHNNKVWSLDEMKTWGEWTPSQGVYPDGYEVKAKDIYKVPSYLGYPGYDPGIDRGGYNCGHSFGFIRDDLAKKMRPDLN